MPRKKYHETLAENIRGAKEPEDVKAEEATVEDLNDTVVQQRIMDPNGTVVKLSYGPITVFPLTMRDKRRVGGFIARVSADAIGAGLRSNAEATLRVASLLMQREDLENELFQCVATACCKPGTATDRIVLPLITEFQEKCSSADVMEMFKTVTDLADFKAPKL